MTLLGLRYPFALVTLVAFAAPLGGCQSDAERLPDRVINITVDGGTPGCSQPNFPSEQPDLLPSDSPDILAHELAQPAEQRRSGAGEPPGEAAEAEIWVNRATRRLKVELANAWAHDDVIYTTEEETSGNEAVSVRVAHRADLPRSLLHEAHLVRFRLRGA